MCWRQTALFAEKMDNVRSRTPNAPSLITAHGRWQCWDVQFSAACNRFHLSVKLVPGLIHARWKGIQECERLVVWKKEAEVLKGPLCGY
jgi:hypothetical protein